MANDSKVWQGMTIGLDVGDDSSCLCVLDSDGEVVEESKVPTTPKAIGARFASQTPVRVVLGGCPGASTFNTTQSVQAIWIP